MEEYEKQKLIWVLKDYEYDLMNYFALIDSCKFSFSYLETTNFKEDSEKYNLNQELLEIGLAKAQQFVVGKILDTVALVNVLRGQLGMRLLSNKIDELYYEIYAVVKNEFDKEDFNTLEFRSKAVADHMKIAIDLGLDDDDDDSNSNNTLH